MSSTHEIQTFKGGNWKECRAFLQRVRAAAWKEGKLRDPAWMADFASIHLSDYALTWYFRLSPEVQQNWPQLQAAFVEKWMPPDDDDLTEPQNVSTSADAPSEQLDYLERVILKVVEAGKEEARYVNMRADTKRLSLTSDAGAALRFRFNPQSDPKILECVDIRPYSWAAIHWDEENPSFGRGSESYAELTAVNCEALKSPTGRSGPFQVAMCRIAKSGEVTPLWRDGNTETTLKVFTNSFNRIISAPDPESFHERYHTDIPATLFIQKVD